MEFLVVKILTKGFRINYYIVLKEKKTKQEKNINPHKSTTHRFFLIKKRINLFYTFLTMRKCQVLIFNAGFDLALKVESALFKSKSYKPIWICSKI